MAMFRPQGIARSSVSIASQLRHATLLRVCMALAVSTLSLMGLVSGVHAQTPVNITSWRYDTTHAGQNTQETLLTPANVNTTTFGKLFSVSVDGYVYAQPLYVSGLKMNDGLVHNVLFVATEHDSVYAFDADSNGGANASPLWHASLLSTAYGAAAGATTVSSADLGVQDIKPEVGITATPAINVAGNTIYVVSKSLENDVYVQRLHALNIITGAEQPNSPVVITGSVAGTGNGSSGGVLTFSPLWQNNRPALNYSNGYVYMAFASHGDDGPWHGWIFAYNGTTLAQTGSLCTSANGKGDGIWMSGAGMPIDDEGAMYAATGNGSYTGYPPFTANTELGNSVVRMSLANGAIKATDAFTAYNQATLNSSDVDQGSGGVLILPDQQGAYPHILIQAGKNGNIEVINRDKMGGFAAGASSNTNILQDITGEINGLWSTPAYWNGNVYTWGSHGDALKRFDLNSGVLSTTPASTGTITSYFPGPSPVVSSNGTQNGIVWAVFTDAYTTNGSEILYAFDATDLTDVLYASNTNARDDAGPANKFVVPVVTNGKVYVGAAYQVDVYGLLSGATATASPVFSPAAGSYSSSVSVKITSATAGATIYYTTDGSTPTASSKVYTAPITIATDTTVNAIASADDYLVSPVISAVYTITTQTPPVTFSPAAGSYSGPQTVTLSDTDASATIYYTLDNSTPTTSSTKYTGPITVSASETIKAIAHDGTNTTSNVSSSSYVIGSTGTTINYGLGFSSVAGLTLNGSALNSDDSRLQLTSGAENQAASVFYNTPVNIQSFVTNFSFQLSDAEADGFTFTIQNQGPTALGQNGKNLGFGTSGTTGGIATSVAVKFDFYNNAGEGNDSTGVFTDGATPTVPAVDLTSSGIELNSGDAIAAQITYSGTTLTLTLTDVVVNKTFTQQFTVNIPQVVGGNTAYVGFTGGSGTLTASQKILTWTFTSTTAAPVAPTPVFTPAAGNYTAGQQVSIAATAAVIHYTTDNSVPTVNSPVYSTPIVLGLGTTTIKALATETGDTPSAISTATYVAAKPITPQPTFTPAPGTYSGVQTVTIADTGSNAVIYYTTNGTNPTTSSSVYSQPIPLALGATSVRAMAVAPGDQQSAFTIGTYTMVQVTTAAPSFTPNPGTFTAAQNVTIKDTTAGATIYYTTNGSTPTTSSAVYSTPVKVGATETLKALAVAGVDKASAVSSGLYTINLPAAKAAVMPADGYAEKTAGSASTLTDARSVQAAPIAAVSEGRTAPSIATHETATGNAVSQEPEFMPAPGYFKKSTVVTLTPATPGSIIRYTVDGAQPTADSPIYKAPIVVLGRSLTVKAFSVTPGKQDSPVVTGTYRIKSDY